MKNQTENFGRYNLHPKTGATPAYRKRVKDDLSNHLYKEILKLMSVEKKYRDPNYSATQMAKELNTNVRNISAVVNSRLGGNYNRFVNSYRVNDAVVMLRSKKYSGKNIEEISALVGFANRQSFYSAFFRFVGITPRKYREEHQP